MGQLAFLLMCLGDGFFYFEESRMQGLLHTATYLEQSLVVVPWWCLRLPQGFMAFVGGFSFDAPFW